MTYYHGHSLHLADCDTIKAIKIIRDSLDAASDLIKVKYVFKMIGKKSNTLQNGKKLPAGSIRNDNAAGNFGHTILCPNCWTVRGASSESILDN